VSRTRVVAVARRVVGQFRRDRRTLGLLFGAPILVLALVGALWGSNEAQRSRISVANDLDHAIPAPVVDVLRRSDTLKVSSAPFAAAMDDLRAGRTDAVLYGQGTGAGGRTFTVELEGSDPLKTSGTLQAIQSAVLKSAGGATIPLTVSYLHGGPDFTLLDHLAPLFIAFFAFFLTFLLSAVSFLRERTTGTLERLLATPLRRSELVLGYLVGFGVFALLQAAVIIAFTVLVLRVRYEGNVATIFLVEAVLAIVAVAMGLFVSAFARTELQAVQFIPIVILPQAFLAGFLVPVDQLPDVLRPFSVIMPLTYAMEALRGVMIKGLAVSDEVIVRDLAVLVAFAAVTITGAVASIRREVA
jgi:ABC-2 type transport system permease protein